MGYYKVMTKQEFEDIITADPTLTTHGFGIDGHPGESFEKERSKLRDCYDEALACEEFLRCCKRTKKPHKDLGSTYHFKHAAEKFVRSRRQQSLYIPEGALIVAAKYLGFTMMEKLNTTSAYLNISKKTRIDSTWIHAY
jgi:hypothetical protein